mgnify:CR=1 FL=1
MAHMLRSSLCTARAQLLLVAALVLSGCANLQPALSPAAQPDARSGYLAGLFQPKLGQGFAFVLRSASGQEFNFGLGQESAWPKDLAYQTAAIALPPGTYRITHWFSYAILAKETLARDKVPPESPLAQPLEVKAGEVLHLGGWVFSEAARRDLMGVVLVHRVQPLRFSEAILRSDFGARYQNLAALPFHCLNCAPSAELTNASTLGVRPTPLPAP